MQSNVISNEKQIIQYALISLCGLASLLLTSLVSGEITDEVNVLHILNFFLKKKFIISLSSKFHRDAKSQTMPIKQIGTECLLIYKNT